MRIIPIISLLSIRFFKIVIYYILVSPYLFLRFFVKNPLQIDQLKIFDKIMLIIIGEIWLFGKQKIDLRNLYENQRVSLSKNFSYKNLLIFMPGQWYTLSPLESSLTILISPKQIGYRYLFFLFPYVLYILLFDESREKIKANHGISSCLALSITFKKYSKISNYYYYKAIKILRLNSNLFFYNEGSTNYHIFVTSLFKNYFFLKNKTPLWFNGYKSISKSLIQNCNFFYFGDDDNSQWIYFFRDRKKTIFAESSISNLLNDKKFKKSVIDTFFKLITFKNKKILLCTKGSDWGHAHIMIGSFMYFIDDYPVVFYKKNGPYTFSKNDRQNDRIYSTNSPINSNLIENIQLAFFKKLPYRLCKNINYSIDGKKILIELNDCKRIIDMGGEILKVQDSSSKQIKIKTTLSSSNLSKYLEYINLTNL